MGRRRVLTLAPALGFASVLAVLIATMLAISSIVGGAAAQQGCSTSSGGAPLPVSGAPSALQPIFAAAAQRYGLGTQGAAILAGLTSIESGFGQNMGPSSAGAIGWTQFMPATWARYGVDANHDGKRDPYNATDAIFSSARYLKASGAPADWHRALFAYNHSDSYVSAVLDRAAQLASGNLQTPRTRANRSTLVIGDSLEVGTFPLLNQQLDNSLVGNFEGGRPSAVGIAMLRRLLGHGRFSTIVFDLGTNDATVGELRRSLSQLARLAGDRDVFVATLNSPFDQRAKNALLRSYTRTHRNVTLIPWHETSRALALADGIHGAYPQRAKLFAKSLASAVSPAVEACAAVAGLSDGPIRRLSGRGRIVPIPGQPGTTIDARILPDVLYLVRTYHVHVSAGYAPTGHAPDGEHPLGLAVDLVPGPGGSWDDVDRLARWAEPTQNAPRPPFRWVGYDGDANHGRGNHLHLSWMHAPAPSRRPPVAWVDTFSTSEATA